MWELQVFLHPVPHKVPVHRMQSCPKMYNVEPGKQLSYTRGSYRYFSILYPIRYQSTECSLAPKCIMYSLGNTVVLHTQMQQLYSILRAGADTPVCSSVSTNDFHGDESNLQPLLPVFPQHMLSAYCVSGMKPVARTITRICKLLCCLE